MRFPHGLMKPVRIHVLNTRIHCILAAARRCPLAGMVLWKLCARVGKYRTTIFGK